MSISIFAPLLYLLVGLVAGYLPFNIKGYASMILTKFIIPSVIIFNISTHRPGVFVIIGGVMVIMAIMLLISRIQSTDPVNNLCFCYLNIGWLGLPVASTLFGEGAAMVLIAAYVGSSLFGNSVGVGLMVKGDSIKKRLLKTLQAPPVWALLIGIIMIPMAPQFEAYGSTVYEILKFIMSFLGMAILGIWLSATSIRLNDLRKALFSFFLRAFFLLILVTLFIFLCQHLSISLVIENKAALYLICLLPPAANIIVLETHYLKTGHSASLIACGTLISIIALGLYSGGVLLF